MLIIFDLDDTLIETSKCLTPLYLRFAFEAMGLAGTLEELIEINEKALSSKVAIREFWSKRSEKQEILQAGLEALKRPLPSDVTIEPVPGAKEVLVTLQAHHTLALVTAGHAELQLQKMKKAGIQPAQFSKLIVGSGPSKKSDYQRVLVELNVAPGEGVVCGDRVEIDLTPAKELGLYTVHFQNGRGLVHSTPRESVDLTIKTLKELKEVFVKT
ncbi:MAG: HAD family hydrolase [Verrucomicrobia bacterium]|nr:HAD family hydrolase [Verrucomicrobiota bacterium]